MSRAPLARGLFALLVALSGACLGCSTLGTKGGEPEGLPHNGTGPYRDLDPDETMVRTPRSAALSLTNESMDTAMVARDGSLFYGSAELLPAMRPDAGMPDATMGMPDDAGPDDAAAPSDAFVPNDAGAPDAGPPGPVRFAAPDWTQHRARRISRSPARIGNPGFDRGTVVLEASQPWEGGWVSDPWAVIRDDGSVLLYYAAAGGIGVATAASVAGPYTVQSAPLIAASAEGVPRRPSVIETHLLTGASHALLMYFELEGRIVAAGSSDGRSFETIGPVLDPVRDAMPARDDRDGEEVGTGGPGALVVTSPAGRSFVRLYYESRRSNGNTLITLAASGDGATFETFGRPVVEERNRRFPASFEIDDRTSLLYQWGPGGIRPNQGTLLVGIAPGGVRLAPEE
ncbi:MAG: hypothetical protein OHK0013_41870 [Sandaracinaceae bacterium]